MTDMDLDELETKARAATPGPWESGDTWVYTDPIYPDDRRLSNVLGVKFEDSVRAAAEHARGLANAEYIAAADPAVVLGLITELRAAIKRADEATASLDARWEHSDHLTAKYYRRMRAAEREMHARELHHFEEEQLRAASEAERARLKAALVEVREWMLAPVAVNWITLDTILSAALNEGKNEHDQR